MLFSLNWEGGGGGDKAKMINCQYRRKQLIGILDFSVLTLKNKYKGGHGN